MAQNLEIKSTSVQLAANVPAILYEPVAPTDKSHIAIFVMHAGVDYLHFSACAELSKRGYRVLCANNSVGGASTKDGIDRKLLDAKLGVAYLRKYPGVKKVVLLGHSGGGMLISAYQNIAENGLKACQGPEKIVKCSDSLADMPSADGVMLLDAHFGDPVVNELFAWNPSAENPELDPYNPRNGYDPKGSKFSDEFLRKYQAQVGKKMNQLVREGLAKSKAGDADGEPFSFSVGTAARLWSLDSRLLSHTHNAWPLLRPDGSIVTQIVYSVRPANGQTPQGGRPGGAGGPGGPGQGQGQGAPGNGQTPPRGGAGAGGEQKVALHEFLNTYAIRVTDDFGYDEDSVRGIDWSSSYSCAPGNVKGIKVPLLTMGMTGSYEYLAAEVIYEYAKSADKTIAFVEGATHQYSTCTQCEKYPGQYGDTQKTFYDYVDKWLSRKGRFLSDER
jgi:pimeloyl-ACP methyl ester carboxylesterase